MPEHLRWRNWATDAEGITGDDLLDFVNNTLLPKLKALTGGGDKIAGLVRMAFEDAYNYMKNGTLMRQVINKINGIDFNASDDRHMFGDIYEQILNDLQSAGNAGEFYTPRAVTQFMVEQVNPRLGETVLDPACGTGGFLTCAIEHLRKQAKTEADEQAIQDCFAGVEKKHLPHLLCITNMLLHGIDVPSNVRHDNTLARPLRDWSPQRAGRCHRHQSALRRHGRRRHRNQLPRRLPHPRNRRPVPRAASCNSSSRAAAPPWCCPTAPCSAKASRPASRKHLLTDCNLHTIVRLPNGVFNPYTGIKTNLLFFTKGKPTTEVWYYEHPYPAGAKSYNKTKPIRIEEFEAERAWWNKRVENEQAWRVSIDTSRPATTTSTSRTRTAPTTAPATWTTCCRNTKSCWRRLPRPVPR